MEGNVFDYTTDLSHIF